jgi:hypothetical protein
VSHRFPTAGASTASTAPASAYIFGDSFWELVCGIPTLRTLAYTKLPKGDDQSLATHIVKGLVFSNILRAFEAPIDWLVRVVVMDLFSSNSRTAVCPSPIPSVTWHGPETSLVSLRTAKFFEDKQNYVYGPL